MKKISTLLFALSATLISHAQVCNTSRLSICTDNTSDFKNAVQIAGTGSPLSVEAKYKFSNAIPNLNLDAILSIDAIVNATMAGAANPTIDDDNVADGNNITGNLAALFSPRIAPDQKLSCTDLSGYVEFTVKFYTHYSGNAMPPPGTEMAVINLNFLQLDMDGFTVGTNGWFKEVSYVKMNGYDPVNYYAPTTELTNGRNVGGWLLTTGSTIDRNGIANCSEVMEKSVFSGAQTAISFRMGYTYKAPTDNCSGINVQPTRDYAAKFSCFHLDAGGPLPVSLVDVAANYNAGKATITWTSLQEHNLESYEIQRSFDDIRFEVAGNLKANNLTSVQQYHLIDDVAAFNAKYIYYRIRIVDLDYSMKLTNTVLIKIAEPKENEMMVFPNPTSSNAQIKVKATKTCSGDITVFDASGKVVLKQQASLLEGNNTIVINNIVTLSEGYYTIRLIANNETFSSKLLIWR